MTRSPAKETWYLAPTSEGGSVKGPFDRLLVEDLVSQGMIDSDAVVSSDGKNWTTASEFFGTSMTYGDQNDDATDIKGEDSDEYAIIIEDEDSDIDALIGGTPFPVEVPADESSATPVTFVSASSETTRRYRSDRYSHGDPDTCTCPHCWAIFPLEDTLFISSNPDLMGDPHLGPDAPQRFKPSSFTPDGLAIDPGGMPSNEMACPSCHLEIPRSLIDLKPIFFSVVGAPASGKSYYLACSTWELRRTLSQDFGFSFTDAETSMNRFLHEYEETLFLAPDADEYVTLRKTELQGELYSQVDFGGQVTRFPRPFIFNLKPLAHNPGFERGGRSIVLYDNAGEHFQPGMDNSLAPTTHLARARCLFFLFDPTKDPRFRSQLHSSDPQIQSGAKLHRQDVVLNETANRVRRYLGLKQDQRIKTPLVVIVSKFDIWQPLLRLPLLDPPYIRSDTLPVAGLNVNHIEDVSFSLRELLQTTCPELVVAAEDFSSGVVYIPVSALGASPTLTPEGMLGIKPGEIKPIWAAIPFLYSLAMREKLVLIGRDGTKDVLRKGEKALMAKLIRDDGESLACKLKDGSVLNVPKKYAGKCLHHPSTLKPFIVPQFTT